MKKYLLALFLCTLCVSILIVACGKKEKATSGAQNQSPTQKAEPKQDPPGQIHAAHILLMYKGSMRAPAQIVRTKEEALTQAQDLLTRIKEGTEFSQLAQMYSDCPSSKRGGDLGFFGKDQMVKEFEDAAFALKKGQVSNIVETPFGYHIIKRL